MLTGLVKSTIQIGKHIVFGKRPNIIFYYPQHFNRSANGTNPYFEPLLKIATNNNLQYVMLEESAGGYPSDQHSIKADALFWLIWLLRKILIKGFNLTQHQADRKIARIVDALTFHKFRANTYITISNSMIDVLGDLNPKGSVFDYQHGIIYNGHAGYFKDNGELREPFLLPNRKVMLWGELYKRNLKNLHSRIDADNKFIVVGYPLYKRIAVGKPCKENRVLVSMQFTSDLDSEANASMLQMLEEFAEEATRHGYTILLKHHPRFAGEVDLQPLINRFDGHVKLTTEPLDRLAEDVKIHVTWGSTTALEYAAYGVPTYFLHDHRFDWASDIFYAQYNYPLYQHISFPQMFIRIKDATQFEADRKEVKQWYESAYSPLNEPLLLKILKSSY